MAITDAILLSPDVILVPVAELPEEVRRKLDPEEGDWAITHPRARTPSRLLDARSAELLGEFKAPRTIVDAVIRYSQARDLDPESTLVEAYPLLERLLAAGFLVAEGSDEAGGIAALARARRPDRAVSRCWSACRRWRTPSSTRSRARGARRP